jgi:hypothetical protein
LTRRRLFEEVILYVLRQVAPYPNTAWPNARVSCSVIKLEDSHASIFECAAASKCTATCLVPASFEIAYRLKSGCDRRHPKEVHRLICRGYTDVVDANLSKYFDSIPHSALLIPLP